MNRVIKFRGKCRRSGKWFYGNLYDKDSRGRTHVKTTERGCFDVAPDTIGQYTGMKDRNGVEIYEGDIFKFHDDEDPNCGDGVNFEIVWDFEFLRFGYRDLQTPKRLAWIAQFTNRWWDSVEVVGNIHDNPELLKGGEE